MDGTGSPLWQGEISPFGTYVYTSGTGDDPDLRLRGLRHAKTLVTDSLCGIHATFGYIVCVELESLPMIRSFAIAALLAILPTIPAAADEPDGLVRLPGQGELREQADRDRAGADRLKPGGGLLISFDADTDGTITLEEVRAALPAAFAAADANGDGNLSALEQQDWAASLPTRDDSLANPARFDPNLDRQVDLSEFTAVIEGLYADYLNEETGTLQVSDLKAPDDRRTKRDRRAESILQERAEAERRRRERLER